MKISGIIMLFLTPVNTPERKKNTDNTPYNFLFSPCKKNQIEKSIAGIRIIVNPVCPEKSSNTLDPSLAYDNNLYPSAQ